MGQEELSFDRELFDKIDKTLGEELESRVFKEKIIDAALILFWIKKGNDYKIIFVDPKETSHTYYENNKIDDFEKLFPDLNIVST